MCCPAPPDFCPFVFLNCMSRERYFKVSNFFCFISFMVNSVTLFLIGNNYIICPLKIPPKLNILPFDSKDTGPSITWRTCEMTCEWCERPSLMLQKPQLLLNDLYKNRIYIAKYQITQFLWIMFTFLRSFSNLNSYCHSFSPKMRLYQFL